MAGNQIEKELWEEKKKTIKEILDKHGIAGSERLGYFRFGRNVLRYRVKYQNDRKQFEERSKATMEKEVNKNGLNREICEEILKRV